MQSVPFTFPGSRPQVLSTRRQTAFPRLERTALFPASKCPSRKLRLPYGANGRTEEGSLPKVSSWRLESDLCLRPAIPEMHSMGSLSPAWVFAAASERFFLADPVTGEGGVDDTCRVNLKLGLSRTLNSSCFVKIHEGTRLLRRSKLSSEESRGKFLDDRW